jgi:hypothetical protein
VPVQGTGFATKNISAQNPVGAQRRDEAMDLSSQDSLFVITAGWQRRGPPGAFNPRISTLALGACHWNLSFGHSNAIPNLTFMCPRQAGARVALSARIHNARCGRGAASAAGRECLFGNEQPTQLVKKGEREFVSIQPVDSATRPLSHTAAPWRRARRRDEAIIQAELRRLAQLGGRAVSEPADAADREPGPYPDRAA